jgi:hypothetical protein
MAVTGSAKGPLFCRGNFVADLPRRFAGGLENPSGAAVRRTGDGNPIGGRVFHELRSPQSERLLAKWSKGAKRSSVWGSNRLLKAPQRAIELTRDLQHAASVAAEQRGVTYVTESMVRESIRRELIERSELRSSTL